MNEQNNKNNKNTLAYKIGYFTAMVVCMCLVAIVVALTIKFIFWLA